MDYINQISSDISANAQGIFDAFSGILPKLVSALIVVLIGYFLAIFLKKVVSSIAKKLKVDALVSETSLDEHLKEAGIKMNLSEFFGNVVKWIILIITLLVVVDIFNLTSVEGFIQKILGTVGNIIVALFVFAITVYVARFTNTIAVAIAKYIDVKNTNLVAHITSGIIYLVGILMALQVLNEQVLTGLITNIIEALVYGVVIALGIAFGLGGQDKAKEYIDNLRK